MSSIKKLYLDMEIICSKGRFLNNHLNPLTMKTFYILSLLIFSAISTSAQWVQTSAPTIAGKTSSFTANGTVLFMGTYYEGVYKSLDSGATWTLARTGLPFIGIHYTVYAMTSTGGNVYAGTAQGVYKSTDNGSSWNLISSAAYAVNALCTDSGKVFAGTNDGVMVATTGGSTWNFLLTGLSSGGVVSIDAHGSNILAGYVNGSGGGVYVSNNNGTTFNSTNLGWATFAVTHISNTWFAGTVGSYSAGVGNSILMSIDSGITWSARNAGLITYGKNVYALSTIGSSVYAGTLGGIYQLADTSALATNWIDTSGNLSIPFTVHSIIGFGNRIFIGGDVSSGVWETALPVPAQPSAITGNDTVCEGSSQNYNVINVVGVSYTWAFPTGWVQTAGGNTNSITVTAGTGSGNIMVTPFNGNLNGPAQSVAVTVNLLPANAGTITGTGTVCQGQNTVTYSVPVVTNAVNYLWALPAGATGTSNTNSITVDYSLSAISGNITVKGNNLCGDGAPSHLPIVVNAKPATPVITQTGNTLSANSINGNQWYNQNGIINGAVNQNYTPTSTGNYYVIASANGCSSDSSNTIHFVLTAISPIGSDNTIRVFPNPFLNDLFIENLGNKEEVNFYILNVVGQQVLKGSFVESTILNTASFPPGIYLIKVDSRNAFELKSIVRE